MVQFNKPRIAIVGNCCSGKTTLANNLQALGYDAYTCPQEHSVVRTLWQKKSPDVLIMLACSVETAHKRRRTSFCEYVLQRQRAILQHAYEHADLYIDTNALSITEVLERALKPIEEWRMLTNESSQIK